MKHLLIVILMVLPFHSFAGDLESDAKFKRLISSRSKQATNKQFTASDRLEGSRWVFILKEAKALCQFAKGQEFGCVMEANRAAETPNFAGLCKFAPKDRKADCINAAASAKTAYDKTKNDCASDKDVCAKQFLDNANLREANALPKPAGTNTPPAAGT